MDNVRTTSDYLAVVTESINMMCELITGNSLDVIAQYDIIEALVELEQATTTFIYKTGFDIEFPSMAKAYSVSLIEVNDRLIAHTEKIQSQSEIDFAEFITALKLETETLKEEIRLS